MLSGTRKNSKEEEVVKMTKEKLINGVNMEQLFSTIDQVKENPKIAQFKFRAKNTWIDGTHNQATIKDFFGALQEDDTRDCLIFTLDEPPVLCGKNLGANPVEYLLVALSGCLTTSLIAHAATKGIEIKKVESRYEGDLDLQGFLGLSDEVPAGYQNIRVYFHIEADLSETEKEDLVKTAQKYSPVFNTITKSAPVTVELDKK
jgi:uncharacterized OsmC-like protein